MEQQNKKVDEVAQFRSQVRPIGADFAANLWTAYWEPFFQRLDTFQAWLTARFVARFEKNYAPEKK